MRAFVSLLLIVTGLRLVFAVFEAAERAAGMERTP